MKHLKQEFDKLTFKDVIVYSLAIISMVAGIVLQFMGMCLPPEGEIHGSVLTAFGINCTFVASLLGISAHYSGQMTKFQAQALAIIEDSKNKTAAANDESK